MGSGKQLWFPGMGRVVRRDEAPAHKEMFGIVCELWELSPKTKSQRSRVGNVVRDFLVLGATKSDIQLRRENFRRRWPDADDSPEAIIKHWDKFGQSKPSQRFWDL
jgi:hypothetical protein